MEPGKRCRNSQHENSVLNCFESYDVEAFLRSTPSVILRISDSIFDRRSVLHYVGAQDVIGYVRYLVIINIFLFFTNRNC